MKLKLERPIVFLDIEATGTNTVTDRIIDLALIKVHPEGSEERRSWRVNPERPIPPEATAIHHITDADVAKKPVFKSVAASIAAFIEGCDLGGFGIVRYDVPLLIEEFRRADVPFSAKQRRLVDALAIFHQRERRDLHAAVRFYCGEELIGAHGAEVDARASLQVLEAQLGHYADLPADVHALDLLCNPRNSSWVDETGRLAWVGEEVAINFGRNTNRTLRELVANERSYLNWILRADFPEDMKAIVRDALAGRFSARPVDSESVT